MTDFIAYDQPFVSYYATLYARERNVLRFWDLSDLQAALNAAYSELGDVWARPDDGERALAVDLLEDAIERFGTEMRRRIRGGQDLDAARRSARRYPPALIARIKAAHDLRAMVARDIGLTGPIAGKICSPLRDDDHTPSFHVYPDHFHDYGTHEHGDVIEWRMRWHRVAFWQAVESLAIQVGIPLLDEDPASLRDSRACIGKVIVL